MSEIDSGGMAFPVTPTDRSGQIGPTEYGLTKREWYAGMALQGLLANPSTILKQAYIPELSYEYADAMIRAGEVQK